MRVFVAMVKLEGISITDSPRELLFVVHGAMGCSQESFKLVWRCHQLLFGFLAKDNLFPVSVTSVS